MFEFISGIFIGIAFLNFTPECKHPFKSLILNGKPSVKRQNGCDYNIATYHLTCNKCGEKLTLERAQAIDKPEGNNDNL